MPLGNGAIYDPVQRGYVTKPQGDPIQEMAMKQMGINPPQYPMANPRLS